MEAAVKEEVLQVVVVWVTVAVVWAAAAAVEVRAAAAADMGGLVARPAVAAAAAAEWAAEGTKAKEAMEAEEEHWVVEVGA